MLPSRTPPSQGPRQPCPGGLPPFRGMPVSLQGPQDPKLQKLLSTNASLGDLPEPFNKPVSTGISRALPAPLTQPSAPGHVLFPPQNTRREKKSENPGLGRRGRPGDTPPYRTATVTELSPSGQDGVATGLGAGGSISMRNSYGRVLESTDPVLSFFFFN